jgi:hypothetical protein
MAIMAELFPEKASAIELTSPYSLVPKRGFRHGSGGDRDRDTQRGFDREMMFNLDAFHLVGQADVSSLRVPLLASSMTSSQSKGDPRTFVRVPRNEYKPQMGEVISGGATLSGKPVEIDQTDTIIHDAARLFGITD